MIVSFRYLSCRGAKVYRNPDGSSRGMGFVRFADETDQQKALVEMNRYLVHGRPMHLKLAPVRVKPPKFGRGGGAAYDPSTYYPQYQDYYNSSQWQMYDIQGGPGPRGFAPPASIGSSGRSSTSGRSTVASMQDPDLEPYDDPRTTFQQNMDFVEECEEPYRAMEESRWFPMIYSASATLDDLFI